MTNAYFLNERKVPDYKERMNKNSEYAKNFEHLEINKDGTLSGPETFLYRFKLYTSKVDRI